MKFCKLVLTCAVVDMNGLAGFSISRNSPNYYIASPRIQSPTAPQEHWISKETYVLLIPGDKGICTEGDIFVCLQLSMLRRTNLQSLQQTVSTCTVLWCDGRTGHLLQLHKTVCLKAKQWTAPQAVTLQWCVYCWVSDEVHDVNCYVSEGNQNVYCCQTRSRMLSWKAFILLFLSKASEVATELRNSFPVWNIFRLKLWQQQQTVPSNDPFSLTQCQGKPSSQCAR